MTSTIEIRDAVTRDIRDIHETLSEAFQPYRKCYTEEAYDITVCSYQEIANRINNEQVDVLVAESNGSIVGTGAARVKDEGKLYLSSMAVRPAVQGKGVGYYLLTEIERRAKIRQCDVISLECCEFLKMAICLYRRFGYNRTGLVRPYHGIQVFEMKKRLQ
ncbi:GNAT family N-acetyltransferase [candidate division WOR-3 bacterium]|nr:GNAT family N-acetyltransferase [candidate division WOR-3 bacterium]